MRALMTAMLGVVTGFACGAAILIGAPAVDGVSWTDGAPFQGPAAPSPAGMPVPVAAVIAPAQGREHSEGPDRRESRP
jgi:hypothetical protein